MSPTETIGDVPGQDPIDLSVPAESHPVTPASRIAVTTVAQSAGMLRGVGIDWGTGTGGLAIAAARPAAVQLVYAIDVDPVNLEATAANARRNGVAHKIVTVWADGFSPLDDHATVVLAELANVDFLVANPPGSSSGDGLDWRRTVLDGAAELLRTGAPVLLQISRHYGSKRIAGLAAPATRCSYDGLVATTAWDSFDLSRPDLAELMDRCVATETAGGDPYTFGSPADGGDTEMTAVAAKATFRRTGESPLTQWQVHRFRRL